MEIVDRNAPPLIASLHFSPQTIASMTLLAICPYPQYDLFAIAIQNSITLWSSEPLRLLSTLVMTHGKQIIGLKWDHHGEWRMLQMWYGDSKQNSRHSYGWDLLIDADFRLGKLQKHTESLITEIDESPSRISAGGNTWIEVTTLVNRVQIKVTPLTRLLPPSMSSVQSMILCRGGSIIYHKHHFDDQNHSLQHLSTNFSTIVVSDLSLFNGVINVQGDLMALRHGHGLTILNRLGGDKGWHLLTRTVDDSWTMTWVGQDMLVTCTEYPSYNPHLSPRSRLAFWIVNRNTPSVTCLHQQEMEGRVRWVDSSTPGYLIVLLEPLPQNISNDISDQSGSMYTLIAYQMSVQQGGNAVMPELVAERRLNRIYVDGQGLQPVKRPSFSASTSPVISANSNLPTPPLTNDTRSSQLQSQTVQQSMSVANHWQLDYDGCFVVKTPTGHVLLCKPNHPWQCLQGGVSKFFHPCPDLLILVRNQSEMVEIRDLRTPGAPCIRSYQGGELNGDMVTPLSMTWTFDGYLHLQGWSWRKHTLTSKDADTVPILIKNISVSLLTWWLEQGTLTAFDLDLAHPLAIQLTILNALSRDRVTLNPDHELLLDRLYTLASQTNSFLVQHRGAPVPLLVPLVHVLRSIDPSLRQALCKCWNHIEPCTMFDYLLVSGLIEEACRVLWLIQDQSELESRLRLLEARLGGSEDSKEKALWNKLKTAFSLDESSVNDTVSSNTRTTLMTMSNSDGNIDTSSTITEKTVFLNALSSNTTLSTNKS